MGAVPSHVSPNTGDLPGLGSAHVHCHQYHWPHRTATVWKTLSPFWGEEYEVHLQPTFHSVSIYVMDEDALRYGQLGRGVVGMGMGFAGWWLWLPAYPAPW